MELFNKIKVTRFLLRHGVYQLHVRIYTEINDYGVDFWCHFITSVFSIHTDTHCKGKLK